MSVCCNISTICSIWMYIMEIIVSVVKQTHRCNRAAGETWTVYECSLTAFGLLMLQLLTEFLFVIKKTTCVELLAKLKSILSNCETLMDTKPQVTCCSRHISSLQCDWEVVMLWE